MYKLFKIFLLAAFAAAGNAAQAQSPTPGEQIDLGLSVDWRGYNIGADTPSGEGYAYAFASISRYVNEFDYQYMDPTTGIYTFPLENISGNPKYDAAAATTDGKWRMPTKEQWKELAENCTVTMSTLDGVSGYLVVSKINGNSIFIPQHSSPNYNYKYSFFLPLAADQNTAEMAQVNNASNPANMFAPTPPGYRSKMKPSMGLPIRAVCDHYAGPTLENIEISCSKTDIFAGTFTTVTVRLIPEDVPAAISFSSSDESIATVDKEGKVIGVASGSAVISVSAGDFTKTVTINVTAVDTDYTAELVDLGLSVKWSAWNLGASSVSGNGGVYPWAYLDPGMIETFKYKWITNNGVYKLPVIDICGNEEYDAVAYETGGTMRLPSKAECKEFVDNCCVIKAIVDGVEYYKATSTVNGKSVLFPVSAGASYTIGTASDDLKEVWALNVGKGSISTGIPALERPIRGVCAPDVAPEAESISIDPSITDVYKENKIRLNVEVKPLGAKIDQGKSMRFD